MRATGVPIPVQARGLSPSLRVTLERRTPRGWFGVRAATADARGVARLRYRPARPARRVRLRLVADGVVSRPVVVRFRDVRLAAFGDANLGDGVAPVMAARGATWPWGDVGPVLRRADVAFGNLECAVSWRGAAVPKEFNFRGSPRALRRIVRFAGLDALNLANNHVGDFGTAALLDTVRHVRTSGALPIGAGANLAAASRPRVVRRLGLRVAFVGFSDVVPAGFAAGPGRPGTAFATVPAIRAGVRAARRRADVVVATFHWGVERAHHENARQRAFARTAFAAGAAAVIGAHPHVLQPIRRAGRRQGRRVQPRQLRLVGQFGGLLEYGHPAPAAVGARRRGPPPAARADRRDAPAALPLTISRPPARSARRPRRSAPTPPAPRSCCSWSRRS